MTKNIIVFYVIIFIGTLNLNGQGVQLAKYKKSSFPGLESSEPEMLIYFTYDKYLFVKDIAEKQFKSETGILFKINFMKEMIYREQDQPEIHHNYWIKSKKAVWAKYAQQSPKCTISEKTAEINGYRCILAECEPLPNEDPRTTSVAIWFAPDVPTIGGLEGYDGLPGLPIEMFYNGPLGKFPIIKLISIEETDKLIQFEAVGKEVSGAKMASIMRN